MELPGNPVVRWFRKHLFGVIPKTQINWDAVGRLTQLHAMYIEAFGITGPVPCDKLPGSLRLLHMVDNQLSGVENCNCPHQRYTMNGNHLILSQRKP